MGRRGARFQCHLCNASVARQLYVVTFTNFVTLKLFRGTAANSKMISNLIVVLLSRYQEADREV